LGIRVTVSRQCFLMLLQQQTFDEAFVRRLREADPEAEQEFFGHFSAAITIKLRYTVRSPELVEDIRQETLLRVLRYLRSDKPLDNPERLGAVVHGVCKNVTLEMQRSHVRHPQLLDNVPDSLDSGPDPEKAFESEERGEMIQQLLAQLSPKDRTALGMIYLEEVARDEACRRLKMADGNFRVVLHRARLQLRKLIERRERQRVARNEYLRKVS
jgi:RNA polymerase sigma factor (sigma-70 family)